MIKNQISVELLNEIYAAHKDAQASVGTARDNMFTAIDKSIYCASLVEKCKQVRKHDLAGFLAPVMSNWQVKAYLGLHHASNKRPTIHDKRQLEFVGLLQPLQSDDASNEKKAPIPPSVISTSRKCIGNFFGAKVCKAPCTSDADCKSQLFTTVCDPKTGCQECISSSQCGPTALGKTCQSGLCSCSSNADCASNLNGKNCLQDASLCGCENDFDCPSGRACTGQYLGAKLCR